MNIKKIVVEKLQKLFISNQSKLFLFFGIIAIILCSILYKKFLIILIQIILYYLIISHINCMIYGGCIVKSWIITCVPIVGIVIFILDYFNKFKSLKDKLFYIYNKYDSAMPGDKINMKINNNEIPL